MFTKWDQLEALYKKLEAQILSGDMPAKDRSEIQRNASVISDILRVYHELTSIKTVLSDTKIQEAQEKDAELVTLYKQEIIELQMRIDALQKELEDLMYPPDELSSRSAYLEIRAGTGGQEAALQEF